MDLVSQRYRDIVASWRARKIDSGEKLAEALAGYRIRFAYNSGKIENEAIHPFADGNGRCGRELMNYLFVLHDHPPVIMFDEDKLAYYGAMETWDAEGDLEPMKSFLKAETVRTWL